MSKIAQWIFTVSYLTHTVHSVMAVIISAILDTQYLAGSIMGIIMVPGANTTSASDFVYTHTLVLLSLSLSLTHTQM